MRESEGNQMNLGETSNSLKRKRPEKNIRLTADYNQTKMLMIFAKRGYEFSEKYGDYELGLAVSSEYDCLIFKYTSEGKDQKNILLQTKYASTKNNAGEFISKGNSKGETLITYFCTYLKAKEKSGNVDSFVIATNICCNGEEKLISQLFGKSFQFQKIINNNKDVFPKLIFGEHLYKLEEKSNLTKKLINRIKKKCNGQHQHQLPDVDQMIFILKNCMESGIIFNEVESFLGHLVYSFNQPVIEEVQEKIDKEFPLLAVCSLKDLHEAMLDYRLEVDKTFISKVEIKQFFKFAFNKINALQRQVKDVLEENKRISKRKKIVAPLNGTDYQTVLLMYFAQRGRELSKKGNYDFNLGVDWEESGKFDDIVISYKENDNDFKNIYMQVKHSEKRITKSRLISEKYDEPFQLFKYFISFLIIKTKFSNLDCCVIATNTDFDATENELITRRTKNNPKVRFCLQKTFTYLEKLFELERNPTFYTFQITDLIVDDLEKIFREIYEGIKNTKLDKNNKISRTLNPLLINVSEFREEIVNFLEKLVFSVKQPNGQELYDIIRESIGKEFYITDSIILDKFYRMMVQYRQRLKHDFLTGTDIDDFFKHMKRSLQNLTTCNTYYSEIQDLNIDYKINNEYLKSLEEFLMSKDESKCQVITKHHYVTLAATQVISLFEKIKKTDLSKYTYDDKFRIFSLGDLIKKTNMKREAIECFKHDKGFNLLIIICDTNKDSKKIFSNLDEICEVVYAIKKKVLYVTTTMIYETLEHVDRTITIIEPKFSDFTEQSQDSLSKKIISFQGSDIKLKDLFTSKQLLELKSDTLEEIIENKVKINKPVCLIDLEGAFKIHSVKITGEQLVHALTQNFDQPVKLLISGINQSEMSDVIENSCGKKFDDQICSFNKDNILNKMIHLNTDDSNNETEFKILCEKFPKDVTYWMKHKNNVFELKQLYKPNFYITRHLYQEEIIIEPNSRLKEYFLSSDLIDLFIFSSISEEQLVQIFEITKDEREKFNENLKENIKIVTEEGAESTFKTNQHYKSCYLLKFNSDIQVFTVQRFSGSLNKLLIYSRKEQTKTLKEEEEFFDDVKTQKVVILINEPGMGKSTTLSSLTQKRLETNWVIRINLKHCNNDIKNLPINLTIKEVVEYLCKIENLSPFARDLATSTLLEGGGKRPLLLLFDGFDELKSEIKDNIISLLKFIKEKTKAFMWITSRKHEQNILKNSLSVFCTKLGKLDDTNKQKSFFEAYWKPYFALVLKTEILSDAFGSKTLDRNEPTKFDIFFDAIFNRLKTNSSDKQDCFVVPLIMVLLADKLFTQFEAFINSQVKCILEDELFDISSIYKSFVQGNYNKYYERKLLLDMFTKYLYNEFLQDAHWGLAFTQIFPNYPKTFKPKELHDEHYKELLDVGLIQSVDSTPKRSSFEFRHRSFAEYFVAELFANQLNYTRDEETYNKTYTFLMQNIFKSRNLSVHHFLENILKTDKVSRKCESINHYSLLKNVKKISTLQLCNSSRSCSDLINDIKKNMNGCYYNGDTVLVYQLLFKFYDEKNDLEITAVKNFLKVYKDKCVYRIVDIQITRIFNIYISKCIELKLKFDDEFIEKELRTKQKCIEIQLTKTNQIDINCLERLLKVDKYDRIYPLLMNIFLALKKPFLFEGNIEKMLNEWYMERDRQFKSEGNGSIQWFERMGIYVSKSLLTLTSEMAKIFKSVLPDRCINGWHCYYAQNIFSNLILYLLSYSHLNLNINKSALLDMFQHFVQFCSINKIRISQLNTKELEFVLNCIKCVVNKSCNGEDLAISVLCLICLGSFNLKVIEMEDKLLIQDPDQEFQYELVTTLKEEIVELMCCKYENDNFEERCNEIADDIKRKNTSKSTLKVND